MLNWADKNLLSISSYSYSGSPIILQNRKPPC